MQHFRMKYCQSIRFDTYVYKLSTSSPSSSSPGVKASFKALIRSSGSLIVSRYFRILISFGMSL